MHRTSRAARIRTALALIGIAVGCDVVVPSGQIVAPSNGGTVVGTLGSSRRSAGQAIEVRPGGRAMVVDATVIGGSFLADGPPFDSRSASRPASAAIRSEAGTVQVMNGLVAGGSILYTRGDKPAFGSAPAIQASSGIVEISGGTIVGGGDATPAPLEAIGPPFGGPGVGVGSLAIQMLIGDLRVSGGVIVPGDRGPGAQGPGAGAVQLINGRMQISGGQFLGPIALKESSVRVTGGNIGLLSLPPFEPRAQIGTRNCSEIRGGQIDRVVIANRQTLFVFGTDFDLPLGDLPASRR
jgi:hypothetical protein